MILKNKVVDSRRYVDSPGVYVGSFDGDIVQSPLSFYRCEEIVPLRREEWRIGEFVRVGLIVPRTITYLLVL